MIFLLVGFFVIALIFLLFVRPLVVQARWGGLAKALSLTPGPDTRGGYVVIKYKGPFPSQPLIGKRGDIPVIVGTRREVYYDTDRNQHTKTITYIRASMESLGLGLKVWRTGWISTLFSKVSGGSDLQIGDESLDPLLEVHAHHIEPALRLLRLGYVREGLRSACRAGFQLRIEDGEVRFEKPGIIYDQRAVARVLDQAVDLSRRLMAAREETRIDGLEMARLERWAEAAHELGMTVTGDGFEGRHRGMFVRAQHHLRGEKHWTGFTVLYDRPLGLNLRLTRQSGLAAFGDLVGLQDIELGDPAFDGRFIVKGSPTETVRELLTPEVRERLIELQDRATLIEISDEGVSAMVKWRVMKTEHLKWAVDAVAATGALIAKVTPVDVGPFRGR